MGGCAPVPRERPAPSSPRPAGPPPRRSTSAARWAGGWSPSPAIMESRLEECEEYRGSREGHPCQQIPVDRKSTRLNSSHDQISYAVFCLKKKKKQHVAAPAGQNARHTGGVEPDDQERYHAGVRGAHGLLGLWIDLRCHGVAWSIGMQIEV